MSKDDKGRYCVINSDTGENKGCSDSRKMGVAHMRALYAAESGAEMGKKEGEGDAENLQELMLDIQVAASMDEFYREYPEESPEYPEESSRDEPVDPVEEQTAPKKKDVAPYVSGFTSLAELQTYRDNQEQADEVYDLTDDFTDLVSDILSNPLITDKSAAISKLAAEYTGMVKDKLGAVVNDGVQEKAVWSTATANDLPDSAFLYIEPGGSKDADGRTTPRTLRHFPYKNASGSIDLAHLRNALARIPQSSISSSLKRQLTARAKKLLAGAKKELGLDQENTQLVSRVLDAVKNVFAPPSSGPMLVWKEADGRYRWLARYSNNFRDDDHPAEIISEASHKHFLESVDKGTSPLPELWLWHVPEWKCGQATALAYDDSGFAVATGYFDKEKSYIAEWLAKQKDVAVSHAMPQSSIERDPNDPSVITAHQTVEISPLPLWAAANKLTGFIVLDDHAQKEAGDMAIPQAKRDAFIRVWGIDPSLLDKLEAQNANDAEKALNENRERKEDSGTETTAPVAETAPVQEADTTPPTTQITPDAPAPEEADDKSAVTIDQMLQPPSRREVADAFGTIFNEIKSANEELAERVGTIEATLKELSTTKAAEPTPVKEVKSASEDVPGMGLYALISQSIIGKEAAVVDGRSSLAKDKPKESAPVESKVGIPFIDRMLSGNPD
jgi:hypothetical protein